MAPPKINFTKSKKNSTPALTSKEVQNKVSLKVKSPPPVKGVPSPNSAKPTQDEVSGKGKEKAVEPLLPKRLEEEVERRTKELEDLRRNPEAEKLKADVHHLVNDLAATRTSAQEKEDKLEKEIEKKKEEINSFYVQHISWEQGLAKKDEELGIFKAKVESQDLVLAEMSAKIEALQSDLANIRDSDEGNKSS
ncbi:Uncharacterized protein Fot_21958 [Forsythia ovata]|uniref:Uncharacterized protein n=1 Tax=Forsythia ovata TaxID=205694 RepID=A0ABD1UWM7_9LAMI